MNSDRFFGHSEGAGGRNQRKPLFKRILVAGISSAMTLGLLVGGVTVSPAWGEEMNSASAPSSVSASTTAETLGAFLILRTRTLSRTENPMGRRRRSLRNQRLRFRRRRPTLSLKRRLQVPTPHLRVKDLKTPTSKLPKPILRRKPFLRQMNPKNRRIVPNKRKKISKNSPPEWVITGLPDLICVL